MLCNAGESKSIFIDIQNPCLLPPLIILSSSSKISFNRAQIGILVFSCCDREVTGEDTD